MAALRLGKVIKRRARGERTQGSQGFLDGLRVCVPSNAKNLVVIFLFGLFE